MSPVELLKECERVTKQGLSRMLLTIPKRRRRLLSNRVRIMPGVIGTVCGGYEGRLHVWVEISDVVRALERVMVPAPKLAPEDLPSGPMAHDGDEPEVPHGSSRS